MESGPIAAWLAERVGFDPAVLGEAHLRRCLGRRLEATGCASGSAYRQRLEVDPREADRLIEELVVPESWFFRDRNVFAQLRREVLGRWRGRDASRPLRLLSAPCAGGEEPCSIAITLLEAGLAPEAVRIEAIDISRRLLARGDRAVYGANALRGVAEAERRRWFEAGPEGLRPREVVRRMVSYRHGNLLSCFAAAPRAYDAIFCRNALIYLHEEARRGILAAIAEQLEEDGLLFVGAAEMAMVPGERFAALDEPFSFGFRRRPTPPSPPRAALTATAAAPILCLSRRIEGMAAPEALEHCRLHLRRHPTDAEAHRLLAEQLRRAQAPREAITSLRRSLYLEPTSRPALRQLIGLYRELGQPERAAPFARRLDRLGPP